MVTLILHISFQRFPEPSPRLNYSQGRTAVPKPGIIVVGASAGGVEALQVLVAGLPPNLDASVFVVLHIGAAIDGQSHLPAILSKAGKLPAVRPTDGAQIETGLI